MEKKIQSFKGIIDLFNVGEDGVRLSFVRTTNGSDYINSSYEKYFKITQIRKATPRDNDDKAIDIVFEGYFDEEAIARDKKEAEEDALVEKITKTVLEKLEEKDKKTVNVEGAELPNELLEQINKTIGNSLKELSKALQKDSEMLGMPKFETKKITKP